MELKDNKDEEFEKTAQRKILFSHSYGYIKCMLYMLCSSIGPFIVDATVAADDAAKCKRSAS